MVLCELGQRARFTDRTHPSPPAIDASASSLLAARPRGCANLRMLIVAHTSWTPQEYRSSQSTSIHAQRVMDIHNCRVMGGSSANRCALLASAMPDIRHGSRRTCGAVSGKRTGTRHFCGKAIAIVATVGSTVKSGYGTTIED